jgi:hypothetical protein
VEVKASTSVKDYHLNDCAAQAWVIEGAGFPVNRVELAHVDTSFVYPGGGQYDGLLFHADVTAEVQAIKPHVPEWARSVPGNAGRRDPCYRRGAALHGSLRMPLYRGLLARGAGLSRGILPRGRAVAEDLQAQGIIDVRDIPESYLENPLHERVREATATGQTIHRSCDQGTSKQPALPPLLSRLRDHRHGSPHLGRHPPLPDPPALSMVTPHRARTRDAGTRRISGSQRRQPHAAPCRGLLDALGDTGPIFVYSHFEKSVLHQIGTFHPDLTDRLEAAIARLEDLLPLMRTHYYHPDMKGSWSIKAVLPT